SLREIEDASFHKRTTIVDANVHLFSVGEIRDLHPSLKRKAAVRSGELPHVVDLAGGRAASIIGESIPARDSGLDASDTRGCKRRVHARGVMSAARDEHRGECEQHETRMNRPSKHSHKLRGA